MTPLKRGWLKRIGEVMHLKARFFKDYFLKEKNT